MKANRREALEQVAGWYMESDGHLDGWRTLHGRLVHYRFLSVEDLAGSEPSTSWATP